ncbi:hypothetical protein QQG55_38785 [Brugia pahangi]
MPVRRALCSNAVYALKSSDKILAYTFSKCSTLYRKVVVYTYDISTLIIFIHSKVEPEGQFSVAFFFNYELRQATKKLMIG